MPQLLSKVKAGGKLISSPEILADKPDLATLVAAIFARWASIEHEINNLATDVLGADAAPGLAMFNVLQAQNVRMLAIDAAAQAAFGSGSDRYHAIDAAVRAAAVVAIRKKIYIYRKADLVRINRDLTAVSQIFVLLETYLRPFINPNQLPPDFPDHVKEGLGTSVYAHRELCKIGLFREALDRSMTKASKGQDSNQK